MDHSHGYPSSPDRDVPLSRLRVPDLEEGLPVVLDPNTGEWVNPLFVGRGMGRAGRRGVNAQSSDSAIAGDNINKPTPASPSPPGCLEISSMGFGKGRLEVEARPPIKLTDFHGRNRELFQFGVVRKWCNPIELRCFQIDLSALQLLTIRRLQSKLVREALEHRYLPEGDEDPAWLGAEADYRSSTMRQYVAALQDHDYMVQKATERNGGDPFRVSSGSTLGFALLKEQLESIMKSEPTSHTNTPSAQSNGQDHPLFSARSDLEYLLWIGEPKKDVGREVAAFRRFIFAFESTILGYFHRFGAGLAVSMFLVAPMVIIIFVPHLDRGRASGIAAGFTFVFAMAAAFVLREILGVVSATAAYAAVLVVFVAAQPTTVP
ncbi:hypothetical protein B0I37DRAFT_381811 [Chaetomium sp. MPI-CAGE-AT-0009]|nr:hypothetical protein B0I37DRAFT_381811 [Chaetomium sp. MPI-CAGE-AT-0009]